MHVHHNRVDAEGTGEVARGRREGVRGSVRQLRSGRWQARLPRDLDPWTRPLGETFETREDAVVELRRTIRDIEAGRVLLADPIAAAAQEPANEPAADYRPETVGEMLEVFLAEHVDLATSTRRGYRSAVRNIVCHPQHGLAGQDPVTLRPADLKRWRDVVLPSAGVTRANAKVAFAVLRSALSWEVEAGRLDHNPALGMTTRRTKKSRAAQTTDHVRLPTWAHVHEMVSAIPGHQERLMFCLYAYTGARLSELLAVEPDHLLPATRQVQLTHVWVKESGGQWEREPLKAGERRKLLVPAGLWAHLARFADAWEQPRERGRVPTLFRPPISYRRGPGIWTPALWQTLVLLPMRSVTGLDYRTKDLRAYAASALVDAGANTAEAQRLLGHLTPQTTINYYLRAHDLQAHDPARTALRFDNNLSLPERLDALWEAWTERFGDPLG